jgi:ATP synthase subunit 6
MIFDIFSSFDPAVNTHYITNQKIFWFLGLSSLIFINSSLWIIPRKINWIIFPILNVMFSETRRALGAHLKGFAHGTTSLFLLIILTNFNGLLPYRFRSSRHLIISLVLGLPLWLILIISRITNRPKAFTAKLLPLGAPDWLNPFLVLVESIRILVRPITLSFRLTANITAGHVILRLIGTYTASAICTRLISFSLLLICQIGYIIFEIGICLIQAYIFCLLLTLYTDDHTGVSDPHINLPLPQSIKLPLSK